MEQHGFRTFRQSGITLRLGDQTALDVMLEVGQPAELVEVNAEASLLQTATGESAFTARRSVVTLPLDGRNFIPLVALSPGVALPGGGSLLPRINGSRPRTNEYIYDGISALQPEPGQVVFYPIIDAIEEFRVNINSYSPEYGRSNGGTVMVDLQIRNATSCMAAVFEFLRNEDLNGRNYFAPAGPKPEFRRNQYGLAVGGPSRRTRHSSSWTGKARAAHRHHAHQHRADAGAAPGHLHERHLRSGHAPSSPHFRATRSRSADSIRSRRRCWRAIRCRTCPALRTTIFRTAVEPDSRTNSTCARSLLRIEASRFRAVLVPSR